MKSMYIITGGILVMIAVFFLAPKQHNSDEKASITHDEIDAYILKKFGNVLENLTPEEKELARQDVADRLAREKAEMRKYGRVLTPDERSEQWWREQDEAAKQAAYAALYAERKDWIDNFPFQPRYHQNLAFDPENIAHSDAKYRAYREEKEKDKNEAEAKYMMKIHEIWSMGDEMTTDEKHAACKKLRIEMEKEKAGKLDPEIEEQRRIIMRHKRLAGFYKQHYRYYPEFEQAYRIFEEEGLADNPIRIAHTMATLEMYKEASLQDPDELHHFKGPVEGKKGNHPYTNQQFLDRCFHWLTGTITYEGNLMPGETPPNLDQARRISKRLAEEIPAEGFTGNKFLFGLADPKDEDMIPGQSLLAE